MFSEGIILCKASITRLLDDPDCFENAGTTIPVTGVLSCMTGSNLPRGPLKKMAAQKFMVYKDPSKVKEEIKYTDISRKMSNSEKKKKKDPLDADKSFLLDLAKKFEGADVKLARKKIKNSAKGVSGHALEALGYLSSREKFWEQI